jgi:lactoylglutathione lyase|uniref:VOC family protein n=1 Tax=Prevotella sp. TaxID=59823 RepID=UPI0025F69DF8|nr:VOC family protein [Prevotella sp.]
MEIKDFTIGVQHIGIPTNDIKKTIEFFQLLGFDIAFRTINGPEEVAFLQLHNLVIETYQNHQAKMEYGAIDHIAIDVKNIDALFEEVKAKAIEAEKVATEKQATSLFRMLDTQVNGLPFWEKGVKFFTIEGPNKEKIEFCERL